MQPIGIPISADEWAKHLLNSAPQDNTSPHKWICERIRDANRSFETLSEDEYKAASKLDKTLRKLSFSEVVEHSKRIMSLEAYQKALSRTTLDRSYFFQDNSGAIYNFIENYLQANEYNLGGTHLQMFTHPITFPKEICFRKNIESKIYDFSDSVVFSRFRDPIMRKVKKFFESTKNLVPISIALEKMAQRSTYKHTLQKTEGIWATFVTNTWGKLRHWIWSNFYDKTPTIKNSIPNFIPTFRELREKCYKTAEKNFDYFHAVLKTKKYAHPKNDAECIANLNELLETISPLIDNMDDDTEMLYTIPDTEKMCTASKDKLLRKKEALENLIEFATFFFPKTAEATSS